MTPTEDDEKVARECAHVMWGCAPECELQHSEIVAAIAPALAAVRARQREAYAAWHDKRAKETPDAFEMEFHQVSAAAIRGQQ